MSWLLGKRRKTQRVASVQPQRMASVQSRRMNSVQSMRTQKAKEQSTSFDCISAERYADGHREIRVNWQRTDDNPDAEPSWEWAHWHYPLDEADGSVALWERRVAQGPVVGAPADVIQRRTVAPLPQKSAKKILKELTEGFCPDLGRKAALTDEEALYRRGRVAGLWLHGADRVGAGGVLWALLRVSADQLALVPHMDLWPRREREVPPEAVGPAGAPEDTAKKCAQWLKQPLKDMQGAEQDACRCAMARQAAIEERQAPAESTAAPPAAAAAALAAVATAETVGEGPTWRRKQAALLAELTRRVEEAARRMDPAKAPEDYFTPADIARIRNYKPTLLPAFTQTIAVPDPQYTRGVLQRLVEKERAAAAAAPTEAAAGSPAPAVAAAGSPVLVAAAAGFAGAGGDEVSRGLLQQCSFDSKPPPA